MQEGKEQVEKISSFTVRNHSIMIGAKIMLVAGIGASALTEGFQLLMSTGNWLFVILGVVIIEGLKLMMGKATLDNIQAGVFHENIIHIIFFFICLSGWTFAYYKSISLSLAGAPAIQRQWRTTKRPPTLLSEDSIRDVYNLRIEQINNDIAVQQKTTWKGSITAAANKNIDKLTVDRSIAYAELDRDILVARDSNAVINSKWELSTQKGEEQVFFFAGLGEAITLLCMFIVFMYDVARNKELGIHKLESRLRIDLDGDGHIGNPNSTDSENPNSTDSENQYHRQNEGSSITANQSTYYQATEAPPDYGRPAQDPSAQSGQETISADTPRRPIGFRQNVAYPTPSAQPANAASEISGETAREAVATCSYKESTADELLELFRKHKSTQARYKKGTYIGNEDTRIANWLMLEDKISEIRARLKEMGWHVVLKSNKYQLEPLSNNQNKQP